MEAAGHVRGREGRAGAHTQQQFAPSQILSGEAARLFQRPVPPAPACLPPPPFRTDWTRLVPPPVLTGHVSFLLP